VANHVLQSFVKIETVTVWTKAIIKNLEI